MGRQISAAWDEAKLLVDAQTSTEPNYDYEKVHTQWLGTHWNSWGWFVDFKTKITSK